MSLRKLFGTDKKSETEGIWIEYQDDNGEVELRFKITRMCSSNKAYTKAMEKKNRKHRRLLELDSMSDELGRSIFMDVFLDTILIDWDNITIDEGDKPLEFNKENAKKVFKEFPDVYESLVAEAKMAGNFKDEVLKDDAKN